MTENKVRDVRERYTLFYRQHFYKQRQAEIGKKSSKSSVTP